MRHPIPALGLAACFLVACGVETPTMESVDESAILATPTPGVTYNIINEFRGIVCLAGRVNDRAQTSTCNDSFTDQFWQLVPAGAAGTFQLVVQSDGRCLAFTSSRNSSEGRISTCVSTFQDQWWRLDPTLGENRFMLRNFQTNKCLVLRQNTDTATESDCTLTFQDQWWTFFPRS